MFVRFYNSDFSRPEGDYLFLTQAWLCCQYVQHTIPYNVVRSCITILHTIAWHCVVWCIVIDTTPSQNNLCMTLCPIPWVQQKLYNVIYGGWFINGSLIYNTKDICYDMQTHCICVYETRDILHDTWHLQHHMTHNTWYLYAHRCTHLLRACRFAINTVQYLYLSVYICISLYMCTTF